MNPQKFQEQILNNAVQMDASVNFQLNGNMLIVPCPLHDYDSLTRSPRLKQLEQRINGSQDEEEQRKLKSWLPFRCPHYTQFRDDYRDREHIVAESFTWQTCIDIDDPELVEKANQMLEVMP